MTNEILETNGLVGANIPLGVWHYVPGEENTYSDLGLKNEHPEMDKYCGLFETLGDKRLQTHLFQGLTTLIKKAV
jgi:hypothetical protein